MPEQLDEVKASTPLPIAHAHPPFQIVIAQEDRKLEQVLGAISNIKGQTLLIGNELSEQAKYESSEYIFLL